MMRRWMMAGFVALGMSAQATAGTAATPDQNRLDYHVLNRLAFGPDKASLAEIRQIGVDAWIDRQLHPDRITESPELTRRLDGFGTQSQNAVELFSDYRPLPQKQQASDPDAAKRNRQRAGIVNQEAADARLARAIYSRRQLQEVLVDFWFNHFNVFMGKGLDHLWVGDYENRAIRPHVFGHFRDLLEATARHPAMLFYLDNWQNTAPGSPGAKGHDSGLNENYARELMELHTLGVDGGYTQADVIALARILTGWGIIRPQMAERRGITSDNGFYFDPRRHDFGDKQFLGHIIHGTGAAEVEQALDILAASPATARHISGELAQYFVADTPPPALVDRLTRVWMKTDGDLRAVMAALFASPEFRDPADYGQKFKTPFEYMVSAVRAVGRPVNNYQPLLGNLHRLGEPLYGCLTPDGYKNTRDAWLNPDAMAIRISFATTLGAGYLRLEQPDKRLAADEMTMTGGTMAEPDQIGVPAKVAPYRPDASSETPPPPANKPVPADSAALAQLLGPTLSANTQDTVAHANPHLQAALILGGPDFQTR